MKENDIINATQDRQEFQRLFTSTCEIYDAARRYPHHRDQLMDIFLNDTVEFRRLTRNACDIFEIAKYLPQFTTRLLTILLTRPTEFQRLVADGADLELMARVSVNHPQYLEIFNQPTIEAAINALRLRQSESEIRKNALVLSQGCRTQSAPCFFNRLPGAVIAHIAAQTGISGVHEMDEGTRIAYETPLTNLF